MSWDKKKMGKKLSADEIKALVDKGVVVLTKEKGVVKISGLPHTLVTPAFTTYQAAMDYVNKIKREGLTN